MLERELARRKRLGLDVPPAISETNPNQHNHNRGNGDIEYGSPLDIIDMKGLVSDGSSVEGDSEKGSEKGNRESGHDQDRRPRVRIQETVVGMEESPVTPGSRDDASGDVRADGGERREGEGRNGDGHRKGLSGIFGFGKSA
jgi:hypothetical protein